MDWKNLLLSASKCDLSCRYCVYDCMPNNIISHLWQISIVPPLCVQRAWCVWYRYERLTQTLHSNHSGTLFMQKKCTIKIWYVKYSQLFTNYRRNAIIVIRYFCSGRSPMKNVTNYWNISLLFMQCQSVTLWRKLVDKHRGDRRMIIQFSGSSPAEPQCEKSFESDQAISNSDLPNHRDGPTWGLSTGSEEQMKAEIDGQRMSGRRVDS